MCHKHLALKSVAGDCASTDFVNSNGFLVAGGGNAAFIGWVSEIKLWLRVSLKCI